MGREFLRNRDFAGKVYELRRKFCRSIYSAAEFTSEWRYGKDGFIIALGLSPPDEYFIAPRIVLAASKSMGLTPTEVVQLGAENIVCAVAVPAVRIYNRHIRNLAAMQRWAKPH